MKASVLTAAVAAWALAACASSALSGAAIGSSGGQPTTGGAGAGTGSSGSPDAGGADAGPVFTLGSPCDPRSVDDLCAAIGAICDATAARCRQPELGEPCRPAFGCANSPKQLSCFAGGGSGMAVCLVPCTASDSSACPYGSSCGDPNLPGFCSVAGSPNCSAWSPCALGVGVVGTCLPDGPSNACLANGNRAGRFVPCEAAAANAAAEALCAAGAVCLHSSGANLAAPGDAGYCFPLCGPDGGNCAATEHCDQPDPQRYGVCRPGLSCHLDADTCPAETVCVPDRLTALLGGCLPEAADAGGFGSGCTFSEGVARSSPCRGGLCLTSDGGAFCAAVCDQADGGRPYCVGQRCLPIVGDSTAEVVGVCR